MDQIYKNLGELRLWGDLTSSNDNSFSVTEGWLNHASGRVEIKKRNITHDIFEKWLAEEPKAAGLENQSLVLRLVWVNVDLQARQIQLSEATRNGLLKSFGLEIAFSYIQSCITDVTALPSSGGPCCETAYALCYMPKLAAIWSHKCSDAQVLGTRQYLTQGIVIAQEKERQMLSKLLKGDWDGRLFNNAKFLAFLSGIMLSMQVHKTEDSIKQEVRTIEMRTGHHSFEHRHEAAATAQNGHLSAKANGFLTKLASITRKTKMAQHIYDFVGADVSAGQLHEPRILERDDTGDLYLRHHASVLKRRLTMQVVDTEYTLKRVEIQVNALAGIISRSDSLVNLSLSNSQRAIALDNNRDSSSMKTLAIVTMFFLPGSFISALFSTSLFKWDSVKPDHIGVKPAPQFTLYWVITIPLTVITFLLYFIWLWFMKKQHNKMYAPAGNDEFDQTSLAEKGENEEGRLARSRKITFLSHSDKGTFAMSP